MLEHLLSPVSRDALVRHVVGTQPACDGLDDLVVHVCVEALQAGLLQP